MSERLRDRPEDWGLDPDFHRAEGERRRAAAMLRARKIKEAARADALAKAQAHANGLTPAQKRRLTPKPLTSEIGRELNIVKVRVRGKSLPFVSFIYGDLT